MEPRSKRGPSWKDSAVTEESHDTKSHKKKKLKTDDPEKVSQDDAVDPDVAQDSATSDMDWLKRHMKSSVHMSEPPQETIFDQSDEEETKSDKQLEASYVAVDEISTSNLLHRAPLCTNLHQMMRPPVSYRQADFSSGTYLSPVRRTRFKYYSSLMERSRR